MDKCDPFVTKLCSNKCDHAVWVELGEAGGGQGVWGEAVKWVVKGVGVRWVEGVDVHVSIVEILLKKVRHEKV